jgi:hypothetical protein
VGKLVGRRRVRKGIVFIAALEGVLLLLVVAGVALLPDGTEEVPKPEVDCADSDECLEFPMALDREATPRRDEPGPRGDFMVGLLTNVAPTKPRSEVRRTCVFKATIRSVDEEDPSVAHVLVHEHDGRKTKAVVQSGRGQWRGVDDPVGESVRFSCANKSEKDKAMPVYEDCRQSSDPFDDGRCADPAGCTPSLDGSSSAFRRVYASGRSSTSRDPKDGCVRAASPSGDCVGFCFNAFVKSVDPQNWRNAKVDIIERNGTRTRAVVHRSHVLAESRAPALEGMPVRFACFDKLDDVGRVPGFEGCVQMAVPAQEGGGAVARRSREADVFDDPLGDFPWDL